MKRLTLAVLVLAVASAGAFTTSSSAWTLAAKRKAAAIPLDYACALTKNGSLRYVTTLTNCRKQESGVTFDPAAGSYTGTVAVCVQADGSTRKSAACPAPGTALTLPPQNIAEYFCADNNNDGRLRHVPGANQCTGTETELIVSPTNHAPTDLALAPLTIPENKPIDTPVGVFSTTDPDAADTTFTYTLVSGAGSTHNSSFNIATTAPTCAPLAAPCLRSSAIFNFEAQSTYFIRVRTTDPGGLFFEKQLTITITDVNEAPTAATDTYAAFGNTELRVAGHAGTANAMAFSTSATNPKANDTDPDGAPSGFANLSVIAASGATTKGGTYAIQTDGAFKYTPPAGVVTAPGDPDTFTYGLTDGTNTVNGTIQIDVTNRIWYADVARGSNGNGTSSSPFNTLAGINTVGGAGDSDSPGDYIFLAAGTYPGGMPLETSQKLYGASHGLVVSATTLATPTGANPLIENAAGDGVTLATSGNNDVQGISIGNVPTGTALKGTNVGTVTVDNTTGGTINAGAGGKAVDINSGALTVSFTSITGAGISLTGSTTGTFTGSGGSLSGTAGAELDVNGGTSNITYDGAITNSAGLAVQVQNKTAGTVALSGLVATSGTPGGISLVSNTGATITFTGGIQLSTGANDAFTATGGGTVNVNAGATRTLTTTTGTALTLAGVAGTITLTDLDKSGVGTGISLSNVSAAVTVPSGATIASTTTSGVDIDQGTGAFSYAGTISNAAGRTVEVTNRNSGSPGLVQFTGNVTSTGGTGVNLDNNDNGTITFSGGLVLSTGANTALNATNGATAVNVTGSSNTLTTTTGTALNVVGTTIGAGGLNFTSITAGTGSGSAGTGIILDTTGSTGGLTVAGDGSNAQNGSGGTIQHKTGSGTSGIGIYLNSTSSVSLHSVDLHDFDHYAIQGNGVNGFTLQGARITGTQGTAGSDGDVIFNNAGGTALSGTANILNSELAGGAGRLLQITNGSGSLTLNVTGSNLHDPVFATDQHDLLLELWNGATMNATIKGNQFVNHQDGSAGGAGSGVPRAIQATANGTSTMTITVGGPNAGDGNTLDTSFVLLDLDQNSSNTFTYLIRANTLQYQSGWLGAVSRAINLFTGSGITGKMTGSVIGNTITHDTTTEAAGAAIALNATGNGPAVANITSNNITWPSIALVQAQSGNGSSSTASMDVNITNNTLAFKNLDAAADHTVVVGAGANAGDTNNVCGDILNNTLSKIGAGSGQELRVLATISGAHLRLPGYAGGATDTAAIASYLLGRNTGATTAGGSVAGSGGVSGGGGCATS